MIAAPLVSRAQVPAQDTAVSEAVYRQANRIKLRQKLTDALVAQQRRDLPTAAKLYDDAWVLVQGIGAGVEAEATQTKEGLSTVRMELARAAQNAGNPREAKLQVDDILRVNPQNKAAQDFRKGNDKILAQKRTHMPTEEVQNTLVGIREEKGKAAIESPSGPLESPSGFHPHS